MTLEDETGFINLVLWAKKFEELRRVATQETLVRVKGRLDRSTGSGDSSTGTLHVIVETMHAMRMPQKLETTSRDFH
jgi:error-prone DNA polymerase